MNKKGNVTVADAIAWNKVQFLINHYIDCKPSNNNLNILFLITVGSYTGLRFSEIKNLKYDDFNSAMHNLVEQKTKKVRKITWNQKVIDVVSHVRKQKTTSSEYILCNKHGKRLTIQYAIFLVKKACYENNINGSISTHSLRKTFGLQVYNLNNRSEHALVLLSDLFGHSSLRITRRYLGIREEEKQAVYLNL